MEKLDNYLKFNKVSTGIEGFDKLLYGGLVIPNKNILIVIRGEDNTEKTAFSLQLLFEISAALKKKNDDIELQYHTNYLKKEYLEDLFLDMLIASAVQRLVKFKVQGGKVDGNRFTDSFFDTDKLLYTSLSSVIPASYIHEHADEMLCNEALYYNNRTNALHLRLSHQDLETSNEKNAVFLRRHDTLSEYLENEGSQNVAAKKNELDYIEKLFDIKYVKSNITDGCSLKKIISHLKECNNSLSLACVNLVMKENGRSMQQDISDVIELLKERRLSILVVRNDVIIPEEEADMVINLTIGKDNLTHYLLNYLSIDKSRFQSTVLNEQQYKRRDYGIEVYPSLHLYCQQRRYLQRALIYTHSNVISETFQQYLDKSGSDAAGYLDYLKGQEDLERGYFNALSPTAYKNFTLSKVLDTVFINPMKNIFEYGDNRSEVKKLENDFLYGNNGGITAVIGEANTFKRFITFGSSFSSAYRKEHTLFLLLNKNDKIVRRRLQCPARIFKSCSDDCQNCYKYLHFMNIMLGCITPAEFLYFLFQQIDTRYGKDSVKRIIIDDLQIVEYCFPLLFQDSLFIPALVDECRDRKIALYILCDKYSRMSDSLRVLADNVVCTNRDKKGLLELYVERYSGYNSKPSKIFAGKVSDVQKLFVCYECGSKGNKQTFYEINPDCIDLLDVSSMSDYWHKDYKNKQK